MTIFLRDRDGSGGYTEIGSGTLSENDWQGGISDFVKKTITVAGLAYTVPKGNQLEAELITGPAGGDIWFAYDTVSHPSVVKLP